MKRRALALGLVIAGLLLWLVVVRSGPTDEAIEIRTGAASPRVREIDLHFQRDGAMERDLLLAFTGGAPDPLRRVVHLRRGTYQLGIRVLFTDGREAHLTRSYQTGAGEPIDLDLR